MEFVTDAARAPLFSKAANETRSSGEVTKSVPDAAKATNEAVIEITDAAAGGPYGTRLEELEVRRTRRNSHGGNSPFPVEPWVLWWMCRLHWSRLQLRPTWREAMLMLLTDLVRAD